MLPRLERLAPTLGRLSPVRLDNDITFLRDDCKSGIETIEAALDVLGEIPAQRRLVVIGGVSEPRGSHGPLYRGLGARVAAIAAGMVVVGQGFQRYASGAAAAGMPRAAMEHVGSNIVAATEAVRSMMKPGDVVLVKGRDSQRMERIVLALAGRPVRCTIPECRFTIIRCDSCPMLERGWRGRRVIAVSG
jgi:UDP-N-acetylmuramoyl-tripeptide--D-alanyl-D-alanine ligase